MAAARTSIIYVLLGRAGSETAIVLSYVNTDPHSVAG